MFPQGQQREGRGASNRKSAGIGRMMRFSGRAGCGQRGGGGGGGGTGLGQRGIGKFFVAFGEGQGGTKPFLFSGAWGFFCGGGRCVGGFFIRFFCLWRVFSGKKPVGLGKVGIGPGRDLPLPDRGPFGGHGRLEGPTPQLSLQKGPNERGGRPPHWGDMAATTQRQPALPVKRAKAKCEVKNKKKPLAGRDVCCRRRGRQRSRVANDDKQQFRGKSTRSVGGTRWYGSCSPQKGLGGGQKPRSFKPVG